jgi:hypothetical protein
VNRHGAREVGARLGLLGTRREDLLSALRT